MALVLAAAVLACVQGDAEKARAILQTAADGLKGADAVAFETQLSTPNHMEGPSIYKFLFKRPNLARLEIGGGGGGDIFLDIHDGKLEWSHHVGQKEYSRKPYDKVASGIVGDLFFSKGPGDVLADATDVTVTSPVADGKAYRVIRWKRDQADCTLRLFRDRPVEYHATVKFDEREMHVREEYGTIDLAPKIPAGAFTFVPPKVAKEVPSYDPEGRLLAAGADAPELRATDEDGKAVKLADHVGKPVVLYFWNRAYERDGKRFAVLEKLRDGGATVLAINVRDEPEKARASLKAWGATRPLVRDDDIATAGAYGVQAYPTTYVIRDGKVAGRMHGLDEARVRAALEKK